MNVKCIKIIGFIFFLSLISTLNFAQRKVISKNSEENSENVNKAINNAGATPVELYEEKLNDATDNYQSLKDEALQAQEDAKTAALEAKAAQREASMKLKFAQRAVEKAKKAKSTEEAMKKKLSAAKAKEIAREKAMNNRKR